MFIRQCAGQARASSRFSPGRACTGPSTYKKQQTTWHAPLRPFRPTRARSGSPLARQRRRLRRLLLLLVPMLLVLPVVVMVLVLMLVLMLMPFPSPPPPPDLRRPP